MRVSNPVEVGVARHHVVLEPTRRAPGEGGGLFADGRAPARPLAREADGEAATAVRTEVDRDGDVTAPAEPAQRDQDEQRDRAGQAREQCHPARPEGSAPEPRLLALRLASGGGRPARVGAVGRRPGIALGPAPRCLARAAPGRVVDHGERLVQGLVARGELERALQRVVRGLGPPALTVELGSLAELAHEMRVRRAPGVQDRQALEGAAVAKEGVAEALAERGVARGRGEGGLELVDFGRGGALRGRPGGERAEQHERPRGRGAAAASAGRAGGAQAGGGTLRHGPSSAVAAPRLRASCRRAAYAAARPRTESASSARSASVSSKPRQASVIETPRREGGAPHPVLAARVQVALEHDPEERALSPARTAPATARQTAG